MNVENARKLIEFIQSHSDAEIHFNMRQWCEPVQGCGTAACLAGFETIRMLGVDAAVRAIGMKVAGDSLGLDGIQRELLFLPNDDPNRDEAHRLLDGPKSPWYGVTGDPYGATREQGIQALENAIRMWGAE